jgi:hypothetical protein
MDYALPYIAGLLDGEGCFRIDRFTSSRSAIGFQYRAIVEITMCDESPIAFTAGATGKNYSSRIIPSGRTAYTIVWRNGIAAGLIRSILPYLIGKSEQAKLCLHFEDAIAPGRGRAYKPEDFVVCEDIYHKVKMLKRLQ